MSDRKVYRKLCTFGSDYVVERVLNDQHLLDHYEMTVTNAINGEIRERAVFNTKREADTGLLDRACER